MAKNNELVFDSDRVAKGQNLRKMLIPLAIIVGVLALVLIIALIAGMFRSETYTGGGDTGFPYTWKLDRNGAVTLEIDHTALPGYSWYHKGEGADGTTLSNLLTVERAGSQPRNKTRFVLTPTAAGNDRLVFLLTNENDPEDTVYEYTFIAAVEEENGKLTTNVASYSGKETPGRIFGGDVNLYTYEVKRDVKGDYCITVEKHTRGALASDWNMTSSNNSIMVPDGMFTEENTIRAYVRPGSTAGKCRIRVFSREEKVDLMVELILGSDGIIKVNDHILLVDNVEIAVNTEKDETASSTTESVTREELPEGSPFSYVYTDENGEKYVVNSAGEELKYSEDAGDMYAVTEGGESNENNNGEG